MIRNLCFGLVSAVALTSAANAADMYPAPASAGSYKDAPVPYVTWSGWYAGVNGGGAWSEFSDQLACPVTTNCGIGFGGLSPSGGFGGGQIGYNWQGLWHPHLVLGLEADIQGASVSAKGTDVGNNVYTSQLDWFGTVRGRIGYATDSSLLYLTGGFAYGGIKNEMKGGLPVSDDFVISRTATGYVLGGGWEYKFSPAWSAKVEYQYINLGKNDPIDVVNGDGPFSQFGGVVHDDAFQTVRAGLNYHFVPSYPPLK